MSIEWVEVELSLNNTIYMQLVMELQTSNFSVGCKSQNLEKKNGKEIVKKCRELLLDVKTLAGLLSSKSEIKEWNNVLNSEI